MAALSVRKGEVEAVAAILENSETYEDVPSLARAVLRAAFDALRERELYFVALKLSDTAWPVFFGVEGSEKAAEKSAVRLGSGGRAAVIKVFPLGAVEQRQEEQARLEWDINQTHCANCGLGEWMHSPFHGGQPGSKYDRPKAKQPSIYTKQKCKTFVRAEFPGLDLEESA